MLAQQKEAPTGSTVGAHGLSTSRHRLDQLHITTTQQKSQVKNTRSSLALHLILLADQALDSQRRHVMATLKSNGDGEDRRHLELAARHQAIRDAMVQAATRALVGGGR